MARSKISREATTGFIYIWLDKKHHRFYIGSHWGNTKDSYICSSRWMNAAYRRRPEDFKRRIIKTMNDRKALLAEEERLIRMIKPHEIKIRYYNLNLGRIGHWSVNEKEKLSIKEKISKSLTGKKQSPETIKKRIEANQKAHSKPEYKKWASEHAVALWERDGHRENFSAKHKAKWSDSEFRERTTASQTKAQNRPEVKKRQSAESKNRWQNPEYREKVRHARLVSEAPAYIRSIEQNEANRLRQLVRWQDPELRQKMSCKTEAAIAQARVNLAKADRSKAVEARRATAARQKTERENDPVKMEQFLDKQRKAAAARWKKA